MHHHQNFVSRSRAFVTHPTVSGLIGTALGICLGWFVTQSRLSNVNKANIWTPGEVLSSLIQSVTLPHILTLLILGLNRPRLDNYRKEISIRAAVYCISTTVAAVTLGVILVVMLNPGGSSNIDEEVSIPFLCVFMDLIRNMVPGGLVLASFKQYKTRPEEDQSSSTGHQESKKITLVGGNVEGVNFLGLIIWVTVIGVCLRRMGEGSREMLILVTTINRITDRALQLLIGVFPLGLVFLTANYVVEAGLHLETLIQLAKFAAVVIGGLIIHGAVILPLIHFAFVRQNPFVFMKEISPALLRAMHPSGGSVNPLTCCEEVNKIDRRVTRSMIQIWGSLNQNGTALYEVIATVFIAQLSHTNLNWSQLFALGVTVTALSSGHAGHPGIVSIIIMLLLDVFGIPSRYISPLLIIHWALDLLSAPVNILGYCLGTVIVKHLSRKELVKQEPGMP
ncbi:excitatory amino acid transporter 3-like [Notolabrus celidotus]|uniref:excitatory amino acid transporter 3-like n=1 Tax=Notolabrus celidotus TaxID=1203425 RepID=UPI00149018F1|nr:excitatory amino acid transporter 3-like [Notolabrus celidotus]